MAGIEPATASHKSNVLTVTPPSQEDNSSALAEMAAQSNSEEMGFVFGRGSQHVSGFSVISSNMAIIIHCQKLDSLNC